jgi:hypothetical protein
MDTLATLYVGCTNIGEAMHVVHYHNLEADMWSAAIIVHFVDTLAIVELSDIIV